MGERSDHWFLKHVLEKGSSFAPVMVNNWVPPCDVFETEESLMVVMELAGIDSSEVEVLVKGQRLIVQGVRKEIPSPLKKDYYLMELNFGPFYREIEFREEFDPDMVRACYRQGFLIIECRKRAPEERRIPVI
jgi:HSP20 family protein